MASDLAGFLISILAILLAQRSATARLTFGYQRVEVIGAVVSVMLIWGLTGYLLYEAVERCVLLAASRRPAPPKPLRRVLRLRPPATADVGVRSTGRKTFWTPTMTAKRWTA